MASGLWKPATKPKVLPEDMRPRELQHWERPYPPEEHDVRVMCLDPIAVTYDRVSRWIDEQDFSGRVYVHDVIEAIFMNKFGTRDTKFSTNRKTNRGGSIDIPEDVPDDIHEQVIKMILETIHDPDNPANRNA